MKQKSYHHNPEREAIIKKMTENWEIDTANSEIRTKPIPRYKEIINWLLFKKYKVKELYIFIYHEFHAEDKIDEMMRYSFPIDHDNIKKPKGIPFIYVMKNGWTIPDKDLKKLISGPLISEHGYVELVPIDSKAKILFQKLVRLLIALTIPGGIYKTWELIQWIILKL